MRELELLALIVDLGRARPGGLTVVARLFEQTAERRLEGGFGVAQQNPILGPARSGDRRLNRAQVKVESRGVLRLGIRGQREQALLFAVRLHQVDLLLRPPGETQVVQGFFVDREEADRRPILGPHVRHGGAIGQGERLETTPVELNKLSDDPVLAKHLDDGQDQVRGCGARGELASKLEAHHVGNQHGDRLTQQARLGLNSAHTPAHDSQSVNHRGMRIRSNERVGIRQVIARKHDRGEVFQIHLVDDPRARGDDAEALKSALAPAQELVALRVSLELDLRVQIQRVARTEVIDLNRVIDHQIGGTERIDARRVPT